MAARRRERDQRRFEQLIEPCDVARKARDDEKADTIRTEMHILEHFQLTFTQVKGKQRSIATQALVAYATARGRGLANSERFHSF